MITLELLQDCIDNKKPFFKDIRLKNNIILVEKYQFIPNFDIKVLNASGKRVEDWFHNLGSFDTYNMIQELTA